VLGYSRIAAVCSPSLPLGVEERAGERRSLFPELFLPDLAGPASIQTFHPAAMTRYLLLALTCGCVLLSPSCRAEKPHPRTSPGIEAFPHVQDLYEFAETFRAKYDLPALGVGIVKNGRIVALGMAGERKVGSGNWATLQDRFDIASCAKPMTATVAAILVEQGKLRWDMSIREIFPDLLPSIRSNYADVTLEMFLRHQSGLEQWMRINQRWAQWHRDHTHLSATEKRRLFAAKVLKDPPRHRPGTEAYYCNDGFLVAGSMMEQVTGRAWEELVRQELWEPLGLGSLQFGIVPQEEPAAIVWGHEKGFLGRTRGIQPNPGEFGTPPFGSPGGFLYASIVDLLRFVDFNIQGANGNGKLLNRDSFELLHRPRGNDPFALAWEVECKRDAQGRTVERSIYHGGYSGRSRSNMWFCPESQTGTVIVYNHGASDKADAYVEIFYALLKQIR